MGFGLLLIRLSFGLSLAALGAQKLFGAFGGHGLEGTGGFFETLGFRPGKPMAALAGMGELVGGLALAAGIVTPLACALLVASMLVAIVGVHLDKGFFAQNGGYELPLLVAAVCAGLTFTGPGELALDAVLGLRLSGARWGALALALGLAGATPPLFARAARRRRSVA